MQEAALDPAAHGPPLGPLDPKPIASPRMPVSVGPIGAKTAPDPAAAAVVAAFTAPHDAPLAKGDEAVRQAQVYLKQLGFYEGEASGTLDWPTVEALVKFDASGSGPTAVIADASRPDAMWLARLKTAAAAKTAAEQSR